MTYPPAPWKVQGYALQTVQFTDIARARRMVPPELDVVALLPGKTLAGVFFAHYGPSSVMEYYELLVVAALARYQGRVGLWISHIYVDSADSMAGGREIWGLPKELAQFTWEQGQPNWFIARRGEQVLCRLEYGKPRWLWRQKLGTPQFSIRGAELLTFSNTVDARLGIAGGHLQVPAESPFAALGLGTARFTYHYGDLVAVINGPRLLGRQSAFARPQMSQV